MCWYHVTFDLEREHTLDAYKRGDSCVQVSTYLRFSVISQTIFW